ncbi:MAG: OmpH family outer membrane protein [Prevotella sp.]|jgi:outer membrane protein|nr:OmpH family outer membrane protein [Prevotella sp.]
MLKKLILVLLMLAPVGMFAQDKFAYVNAEEVFSKMPELKDVESQLLAKREQIKGILDGIQTEHATLMEKFRNDTTQLSEAILLDRQKQISDLESRYETYMRSSQEELEKLRVSLVTPLQEKLGKAIKDVGDENGYTYILNSVALLYWNANAVDVAPKVKAKLGIAI